MDSSTHKAQRSTQGHHWLRPLASRVKDPPPLFTFEPIVSLLTAVYTKATKCTVAKTLEAHRDPPTRANNDQVSPAERCEWTPPLSTLQPKAGLANIGSAQYAQKTLYQRTVAKRLKLKAER